MTSENNLFTKMSYILVTPIRTIITTITCDLDGGRTALLTLPPQTHRLH